MTNFKRKEVDDVLGGEKAWENVDQTDGGAICGHVGDRKRLHVTSLSSTVSKVRTPSSFLFSSTDTISGRANDHLLQVRQMRNPMERTIVGPRVVGCMGT